MCAQLAVVLILVTFPSAGRLVNNVIFDSHDDGRHLFLRRRHACLPLYIVLKSFITYYTPEIYPENSCQFLSKFLKIVKYHLWFTAKMRTAGDPWGLSQCGPLPSTCIFCTAFIHHQGRITGELRAGTEKITLPQTERHKKKPESRTEPQEGRRLPSSGWNTRPHHHRGRHRCPAGTTFKSLPDRHRRDPGVHLGLRH